MRQAHAHGRAVERRDDDRAGRPPNLAAARIGHLGDPAQHRATRVDTPRPAQLTFAALQLGMQIAAGEPDYRARVLNVAVGMKPGDDTANPTTGALPLETARTNLTVWVQAQRRSDLGV